MWVGHFSFISFFGVDMLSFIRRSAGVCLLPVLLAACASGSGSESKVQAKAIDKLYTVAYIGNLSSTLVDDDKPDEARIADKKTLDEKLPSLVKEAFEDQGFAMPAGGPEKKAGVVLVNLNVRYNPGNRALRWVGGMFGAGKGTVEAKIEAVDAFTGVVIAAKSDSDNKRMGAFGGNFYGTVENLVESLAEDLSEELGTKIK
jgi:hypothetical protein